MVKRLTKRFAAFFLALVFTASLLPTISAMAATSGECGESVTWTLNDDGTLTISGTGDITDYTWDTDNVKAIIIENGVTSIGDWVFADCKSLTSVTIPDSVTNVGFSAFADCTGLTSIAVDENNEYYCSIDGNLFNKEKTELIQYAIGKTDTAYTIPNSVTSIGSYALSGCSGLTSVTIPDSVTSIGLSAFYNCSGLTSIAVDENNEYYCSIDGNLFNKDKTKLIQYAIGKKDTSYTIPDNVTSVSIGAFRYNTYLTSVTIPNSITEIGPGMFALCTGLTSVTIPDSVTQINENAFYKCSSLTSVTIPDSVTQINENAFYKCSSLTSVTIPDSVTSIDKFAFDGCSALTDVYYTGAEEQWNAINIGEDNTPLTSANIHYSYTPTDATVSGTCGENLTWTLDNSGVLTISGTGDMYNWESNQQNRTPWFDIRKNVTAVVIEDGVTSIGNYAFALFEELKQVTIPNGVKTIGNSAFNTCKNVVEIKLPSGVESIGSAAFLSCNSISYMIIPDSVTSIGDAAFENCGTLRTLIMSENVTRIGDFTFDLCGALETIVLPKNLKFIGEWAFDYCKKLENVYFTGTEEQWNEIELMGNNDYLLQASRVVYNYVPAIYELPIVGKYAENISISIRRIGSLFDMEIICKDNDYESFKNNIDIMFIEYNPYFGNILFVKPYECTQDSTLKYRYLMSSDYFKIFMWTDDLVPVSYLFDGNEHREIY